MGTKNPNNEYQKAENFDGFAPFHMPGKIFKAHIIGIGTILVYPFCLPTDNKPTTSCHHKKRRNIHVSESV